MLRFFRNRIVRLGLREEGAAAVEFAICLIPLVLIVGGIIDFGQLWYMESVLATATREGARYAARYTADTTPPYKRIVPGFENVKNYIDTNYGKLFSPDQKFNVSLPLDGDTSFSSTTAGTPISITVTAQKNWFFLNNFIPGLTNPQPLSSTTVMSLE